MTISAISERPMTYLLSVNAYSATVLPSFVTITRGIGRADCSSLERSSTCNA